MRNYFIVITSLLVIFCTSCNLVGIQGSGVKKTEHRELDTFTSIQLDSAADVNVTFGETQSVTITSDDNILELIDTSVSNGKLKIKSNEWFNTDIGIKIDITITELNRVDLDGAGDININDLSASSFIARIDGAGDIYASGLVSNLDVKIDGAGNIKMYDLTSDTVKARINGAGDIKVYVTQNLDAEIDGAGDIFYKGPGQVSRSKIDGAGKISSKN